MQVYFSVSSCENPARFLEHCCPSIAFNLTSSLLLFCTFLRTNLAPVVISTPAVDLSNMFACFLKDREGPKKVRIINYLLSLGFPPVQGKKGRGTFTSCYVFLHNVATYLCSFLKQRFLSDSHLSFKASLSVNIIPPSPVVICLLG